MNHKRVIVATAALGLVLILAWGCQNSKPVGPMKYVSMKASVSTKGIAKPSQNEYAELLYRITGPSMNPVSGKVTLGIPEFTEVGANASAVRPSAEDTVNFTVDVPAGPSRILAVQVNLVGIQFVTGTSMADPNEVFGIGATRFDIDPGTQVVNVPVEIGPMCSFYSGNMECYSEDSDVAFMGNTDLVNCAYVPNEEAFYNNTCDAKMYFYNGNSGPVDTVSPKAMNAPYLEVGDVYCFSWEGGHAWAQVAGTPNEMYWRHRNNYSVPYYAFDPEFYCQNNY
jgi:hypothetical protein